MSLEKEIVIEVRDVYGMKKYYPICSNARCFAKLAQTTTLTLSAITLIKELGYLVTVQQRVI